jgi:hypothetical protein
MTITRVLLATLSLAALGCEQAPSAASSDSIVAVWKDKGLEPGGFADVDGSKLGGGKCRAGSVAALEATLCEYADATAAKNAEAAGLAAVGEATGVALARGKLLLVLADRRSADPNGRKMNQAAKAFVDRAGK